jgi:hypothetical protein
MAGISFLRLFTKKTFSYANLDFFVSKRTLESIVIANYDIPKHNTKEGI